jgi:hypothetical protein
MFRQERSLASGDFSRGGAVSLGLVGDEVPRGRVDDLHPLGQDSWSWPASKN